jgi:hypothetical protein
MALRVEYKGGTTTELNDKPPICFTCKTRKRGVFGVDGNGNPRCADCAKAAGRPIPGSEG